VQACLRVSGAILQNRVPLRRLPRCNLSTSAAADFPQSMAEVQSSQPVQIEMLREGICVLRLNRPAVMNAMSVEMGHHFENIVHAIREFDESTLRAVVLTGNGKAFSSGGDLDYLLARTKDTPENNKGLLRSFYGRFLSLRKLPVPIIAAINGPAVGAGLCISLACDIRVCSPSADLGFMFLNLGLHPGMGSTFYLPKLVKTDVAWRLLARRGLFKPQEALELGVVSELHDLPLTRALELASEISKKPAPAVRSLVKTLRSQQDVGLDHALMREAEGQAECFNTPEFIEQVERSMAKSAAKTT